MEITVRFLVFQLLIATHTNLIINAQECADDPDYRRGNDAKKSCKYLGYPNIHERRIKNCKKAGVLRNCPVTCGVCCRDNDETLCEEYKTDKVNNCKDSIKSALCPKMCGVCCFDNVDYTFNKKGGNKSEKNCRWINTKKRKRANCKGETKSECGAACGKNDCVLPRPTKFWLQLGADIDGENARDYSGTSVSLSNDGKTVAIGASGNGGNGPRSGHCRVYTYEDGKSEWIQLGEDIDGESAYDNSGNAVSISDDGRTVAVGASRSVKDDAYYKHFSGHVKVHRYDNNLERWMQLGNDIDGEGCRDFSGGSVSLSNDGRTVAIGAEYNDGNEGDRSGHTRIMITVVGNKKEAISMENVKVATRDIVCRCRTTVTLSPLVQLESWKARLHTYLQIQQEYWCSRLGADRQYRWRMGSLFWIKCFFVSRRESCGNR